MRIIFPVSSIYTIVDNFPVILLILLTRLLEKKINVDLSCVYCNLLIMIKMLNYEYNRIVYGVNYTQINIIQLIRYPKMIRYTFT